MSEVGFGIFYISNRWIPMTDEITRYVYVLHIYAPENTEKLAWKSIAKNMYLYLPYTTPEQKQ